MSGSGENGIAERRHLSRTIEHTLLRPHTVEEEIVSLAAEAGKYGFFAICVLPVHVQAAVREVDGEGIKVVTVVGFPLGAAKTRVKVFEAREAVDDGADELDMVMALSRFKEGDDDYVGEEIVRVVEAAQGRPVKVILETGLLDEGEIVRACALAARAGARFVKTSTGISWPGASVEAVSLMSRIVAPQMEVKASGGIKTLAQAQAMLAAGASRLGTSNSVGIMEEFFCSFRA